VPLSNSMQFWGYWQFMQIRQRIFNLQWQTNYALHSRQNYETFDVLHAFLSFVIAKLSPLKNSPAFWPTPYIALNSATCSNDGGRLQFCSKRASLWGPLQTLDRLPAVFKPNLKTHLFNQWTSTGTTVAPDRNEFIYSRNYLSSIEQEPTRRPLQHLPQHINCISRTLVVSS